MIKILMALFIMLASLAFGSLMEDKQITVLNGLLVFITIVGLFIGGFLLNVLIAR